MDQSAAADVSQSAVPLVDQSQPRIYTLPDQSEASNPGSFHYKSRCRGQFVTPQVRNTTFAIKPINSASRNTLSSTGIRWQPHRSNTPVRRHSTAGENQLSNTPVRRQSSARENQMSNTPVRRQSSARENQLSNTPVRRQSSARKNHLSNTPVRCQATGISQLSNAPVRRSVRPHYWSNTLVRRQPNPWDSISTNSLPPWWTHHRMRRRQSRRHRFRSNAFTHALYVAAKFGALPIIASTCCHIMGWIWSGLLWCMTTTPTRINDLEPYSDD